LRAEEGLRVKEAHRRPIFPAVSEAERGTIMRIEALVIRWSGWRTHVLHVLITAGAKRCAKEQSADE
jgi:hypothetical protein